MKQTLAQYAMIALMLVGAYLIGFYKAKSELLEKKFGETGVFGQAQQPQQLAQQDNPTKLTDEQMKALFEGKGNIVLGKKNAKLLIAEFSDPSCPFCHIAAGKNPELNEQVGPQFKMVKDGGTYEPIVPAIKKLVDEGKARFVWLYTPGHGNGELGTKALYCAFEKGKFWEVHDLLMTSKGYDLLNNTVKNDVRNSKVLAEFLAPAFDAKEMQKCLESGKYDARVVDDPNTIAKIGRFGTPTFVFGNEIVEGARSYGDGVKSIVEGLLK